MGGGWNLGDLVPDIQADSTQGHIKVRDYCKGGWTIIFSHPGDFTPVCTTELGKIAAYNPEFEKRGVKLLGLSTDSVEDHQGWIKDIESYTPDAPVLYPILADPDRKITVALNMLDPDEKDEKGRPLASRALHIVGPDCKLKLSFLYPGTTGRNFDEVVRVIDALQLASRYKIATPANWNKGEPVVIPPSLSVAEDVTLTLTLFGFDIWQLKLSFLYPGTTGRNFDEVVRVIDALQLASRYKIATPANWNKGEPVVISPSLSDAEAKKMFPQGWETVSLPSGKPYLRMTFVD